MSSYSFVANARFNPLTYDEMIKPLAQYKEVYDTMDKAYSELASQSEAIRKAVEAEPNSQAYKDYNAYTTGLNSAVEDFSKGMNTSTRSALLGLKKNYARDIVPITTAISKRDALAQEQRKLKAQDNSLIFQRDAGSMSIDDFVQNPSADYGQAISGAMLAKQTQNMAASLAKEARTPEGKAKLKELLPFTYDYVKEYGFSSEAVMAAIMREPNANKILTGIVDQVVDSSGVKGWGSQKQIQQAYWWANQGLTAAVGETKSQILQDSYSSQLALMKEKAKLEAAVTPPQEDTPIGEYLPLRDTNEIDDQKSVYQKYQEKGYFTKDNKLTKKGLETLRQARGVGKNAHIGDKLSAQAIDKLTKEYQELKQKDPSSPRLKDLKTKLNTAKASSPVSRVGLIPDALGFFNWYQQNIGGYDINTNKVITPNTNINKFLDKSKNQTFDLYHTFKGRVQQTESNGNALLREIKPEKKGIPTTHYVKGKGMRDTGDYVKVEDLDKYVVTGVEGYLNNGRNFSANSTISYQLSLVPKGGQSDVKKAVTVRITPSDFAPEATSAANRAIRKGALLSEILRVGYVPQRESDGSIRVNKRTGQIMFTDKKLNADEKISLTQEVTKSKNEMGYAITQFIRPAETETTKTHSYIQ